MPVRESSLGPTGRLRAPREDMPAFMGGFLKANAHSDLSDLDPRAQTSINNFLGGGTIAVILLGVLALITGRFTLCGGLAASVALAMLTFKAAVLSGDATAAIKTLNNPPGRGVGAVLAFCFLVRAVFGDGMGQAFLLAAAAAAAVVCGSGQGCTVFTADFKRRALAVEEVELEHARMAAAAKVAAASIAAAALRTPPTPAPMSSFKQPPKDSESDEDSDAAEEAAAEEDEENLEPFDAYVAAYGRQIARIVRHLEEDEELALATAEDVRTELAEWLAANPPTDDQVANAKDRRVNRDAALKAAWKERMSDFDDKVSKAREEEAQEKLEDALGSGRLIIGRTAAVGAMPLSGPALTTAFPSEAATSEKSIGVVTHPDGSVAYIGQVALHSSGRERPHGVGAFYSAGHCHMDSLSKAHPRLVGNWQHGVPDAASDFKLYLIRDHADQRGVSLGYYVGTVRFRGGAVGSMKLKKKGPLTFAQLDPTATLPWRL